MALRQFPCSKDVPVRSDGNDWGDKPREGAPQRQHLYAGRLPKRLHRSFLDFAFDFSDVTLIRKAELVLTTSEADNEVLDGAKARVYRLTSDWSEGGGTGWTQNGAINPSHASGTSWAGPISPSPGGVSRIDITGLVGRWAGPSIRWLDDGGSEQPGGGADRFGLLLTAAPEQDASAGFEVWSSEAGNPDQRPYIEITYDPANEGPDFVTTISPDGDGPPGQPFTGEYQDPENDPPARIDIEVRYAGGGKVWGTSYPGDPMWPEAGGIWTWSVPDPGPPYLTGHTHYEWRAKGFDGSGRASAWTNWRPYRQMGTVPTIGLVPIGTRDTLAGVLFQAAISVGSGLAPASVHLQLRRAIDPWTTTLWDELLIPLTYQEKVESLLSRQYGGVSLPAGQYAWRARVTDSLGVQSAWSGEDVFELTVGSEAEAEWGSDPSKTTGYTRSKRSVRVVLRDMSGTGRGPGVVKAIIENPENLGISSYVNEPGEMYFTLPAIHPQASECEPYQRHYAVQQYRNGNWLDISNGILTDFDATPDDVVVYGIDYLGLLSLSVDTRMPTTKNYNEDQRNEGGAKYVDETIDYIVQDQLERAAADSDAPTGFIHIGNIDALETRVSIFCSFVQRLDFIRGLLDSHRQGTGIRSRLKCRKDPSQNDRWEWDLSDNPGFDRDNLTASYGSLVQGFRVIGMGSFATRAHGMGREPTSVKPEYALYPPEGSSDSMTGLYGNIQKVEVWQDIVDRNDLKRRVRQIYQESAKVGKRIALGLRVHGLNPKDGYDLTDNIPLDIDRGVVETERYGSGYWTIWGDEYRVYPDGHDELTLVIRPREDGDPADPDLIGSDPIEKTKELCWGHGPPPGYPEDPKCPCDTYIDLDTGTIYECKGSNMEDSGGAIGQPDIWTGQFAQFDDFEVPGDHDGTCNAPSGLTGLGENLSNSPAWEAECWPLEQPPGNFLNVSKWHLASDPLGDGDGAAVAFSSHGYDVGNEANPTMYQNRDLFGEGPWSHKTIMRMVFSHLANPAAAGPEKAVLRYVWRDPDADPPNQSEWLGTKVMVVLYDGVSIPAIPAGIYVNTIDDGTGGVYVPMTFDEDTKYTLEVDTLAGVKVRCAETGALDASGYLAVTDYATDIGQYLIGTCGFSIEARLYWDGADILDPGGGVRVHDLRFAYGPTVGQTFQILVGVGNESDVTFQGWPTQEGSCVWRINDLVVEPESYDDETGTVTFSRPPGELAPIVQTGVFAG